MKALARLVEKMIGELLIHFGRGLYADILPLKGGTSDGGDRAGPFGIVFACDTWLPLYVKDECLDMRD
ncbi:MAG: hypothetical protein ABI948_06030 [Thermoleophilia bacterium]